MHHVYFCHVFHLVGHSDLICESQVVTQSQPIVAMLGDDIILPCHVTPDEGLVNKVLEWMRQDLKPRSVHMRRFGENSLDNQNPSYKERTSVSIDNMKQGDMSLKLSKVKLTDEGIYRCFTPELKAESFVQLNVGKWATLNHLDESFVSVLSGVLECKSKGWYPEPELLWLDGEGKLLSAGPTETVRGPDDLYTVSSRVTLFSDILNTSYCFLFLKLTSYSCYSFMVIYCIFCVNTIDFFCTQRTRRTKRMKKDRKSERREMVEMTVQKKSL
uniref:Ig-like domain-containing protein n=1 Tax=Seriola dumerili TaxID=41447 RepID=A0A3B4TG64_SERDU